jgi:hypothetical protein
MFKTSTKDNTRRAFSREDALARLSNLSMNTHNKILSHDRIYSIMLATLAAIAMISCGLLLFLAGASIAGSTHLPGWSWPWVALINFAYGLAIIVVLCARGFQPKSGRKLARILNWALLPALPGGTLVGIYGLCKADRKTDQAD